MNYFYNIPEAKLNQFRIDFLKVVTETIKVLNDYHPSVAEEFEKNSKSFLQIIDSFKEIKHLRDFE